MQSVNLQANKDFSGGYTFAFVGTFGENVRRLRIAAGLKGNQLAQRVNVKPPVVSGWEKNRTGLPEAPTLLRLAKAMRCSVEDLLMGVDAAYDEVVRQRQADVIVRTGDQVHIVEAKQPSDDAQKLLALRDQIVLMLVEVSDDQRLGDLVTLALGMDDGQRNALMGAAQQFHETKSDAAGMAPDRATERNARRRRSSGPGR